MAFVGAACGGSDPPLQTDTTPATTASSTTTTTSPPTSATSSTTTTPTTTPTTAAPTTTTAAPTTTAAEVAAAELYAANCARCHGADLEGGVGPSLGPGGHADDHTEAELIEIVTNGKNIMPAFAGQLTEQQIIFLVAFVGGHGEED